MAADYDQAIGSTLRTLRRTHGLTQFDVAQMLHTQQAFVSKTEEGNRSLRLEEAVLYAMGLSMNPAELYEELSSAMHEAEAT